MTTDKTKSPAEERLERAQSSRSSASTPEERSERAAEVADEAQDLLPENTLCELCNRAIEGEDWVINPSGNYAHRDGNCPGDDSSEAIQDLRYTGAGVLVDKEGNVHTSTNPDKDEVDTHRPKVDTEAVGSVRATTGDGGTTRQR